MPSSIKSILLYLIGKTMFFLSWITNLTKSKNEDQELARKEKILNILCLSFSVIMLIIFVLSIYTAIYPDKDYSYQPVSIVTTFSLFSLTIVILYLSKTGRAAAASSFLIITIYSSICYASINWGVDLPSVLLFLIILIFLSGILMRSKIALVMAIISFIHLYVFFELQKLGYISKIPNWKLTAFKFDDVLEYGAIMMFGALFSWLGNKEYERALEKSLAAEQMLTIERDSLEEKVKERTRQIYSLQIDKINSMYRMVEFGRISSGLFHDIMSPLTHLSLCLYSKDYDGIKQITDNIIPSINKIQNVIAYSRKHIKLDSQRERFDCVREIEQCLEILKSKINLNNILVTKNYQNNTIFGSPTLFSHIIINLLSNAIDAQTDNTISDRLIIIQTKVKNNKLYVCVTDRGVGLNNETIKNIFEPFYSTKGNDGCGIGLSATKHILEKYFDGKIHVKSKVDKGSTFTVEIPMSV